MADANVRVQGVLYRCVVRYASHAGLDPLAHFFYTSVIPEVPRIDALVGSFGLPPRVVQDVLAELLRRGYVTLDLEHGEVHRRPGRPELRDYQDREKNVWQDLLTGQFLPYALVSHLDAKDNADAKLLDWNDEESPVDFVDAPSTRVIASLNLADPSYLAHESPDWTPHSVVRRERVGPFDLLVPVRSTTIGSRDDAETVEYVMAEGLPRWLNRAWSVSYLRRHHASKGSALPITQAFRSDRRASESGPLDECRLRHHADRWLSAFADYDELTRKPADLDPGRTLEKSRSLRDARREERSRREALALHLRAAAGAGVSFGPPGPGHASHLAELRAEARSDVLAYGKLWTRGQIFILATAAPRADRERRASLALLYSEEVQGPDPHAVFVEVDPGAAADLVTARLDHEVFPEFAVADGVETRIGPPGVLLSDGPAVRVVGWTPTAAVVSALAEQDGVWRFERWLDRTAAEPDRTAAEAREALELADELARFDREIPRPQAGTEVDPSAEAELAEAEAGGEDAPPVPVVPADPGRGLSLLQRAQVLHRRAADDLAPRLTFVADLPRDGFVDLLNDVLRNAARNPGDEVDLLVDFTAARFWERDARDLVREAAATARVRFVVVSRHPAGGVHADDVERFRLISDALGPKGPSVASTPLHFPNGLLYINAPGRHYVAIGRPGANSAGFAVDSERFLRQIRTTLAPRPT